MRGLSRPKHAVVVALSVAAFALWPTSVTADTSDGLEKCSGDPELSDATEFVCGEVVIKLSPGVALSRVLRRSAPTATLLERQAGGHLLLAVPRGTEPMLRDALRADPGVTYASLIYIGYIEPWFAPGYRDPPDAKHPTAGICAPGPHATVPGPTATVVLGIDTAGPRCTRVRPEQRLTIRNETGAAVTVNLTHYGTVAMEIQPGETRTFAQRFGDVWTAGVHHLDTSLYRVEIWLLDDFPDTAVSGPPAGIATELGSALLALAFALASVTVRKKEPIDLRMLNGLKNS